MGHRRGGARRSEVLARGAGYAHDDDPQAPGRLHAVQLLRVRPGVHRRPRHDLPQAQVARLELHADAEEAGDEDLPGRGRGRHRVPGGGPPAGDGGCQRGDVARPHRVHSEVLLHADGAQAVLPPVRPHRRQRERAHQQGRDDARAHWGERDPEGRGPGDVRRALQGAQQAEQGPVCDAAGRARGERRPVAGEARDALHGVPGGRQGRLRCHLARRVQGAAAAPGRERG
mmetsp:Transcript_21680/g.73709  ORF Transcript_21680/g.73709 Transcript_21680/m.73709 type:complete len:229 (+) Transcript_21680:397-1083(+)